MTEKMDCSLLSASDEFFIEFELNENYHKSIDELRQMKEHLMAMEESTPSDATSQLRRIGEKLNGEIREVEAAVGDYEPEQFDNIHTSGW